MKICNVITDLLPLYKEGLLSQDSKDFLEKHLNECPGCREDLKAMGEDPFLKSSDEETNLEKESFLHLTKEVKKEKHSFGIALIMGLVALLIIVVYFLTKPESFRSHNGLYETYKVDNKIFISFNDQVSGTEVERFELPDSEEKVISIKAYTRSLDRILNRENNEVLEFDQATYDYIFYDNEEVKDMTRIDGKGPLIWGGMLTLARLALNIYFQFALALMLVLILLFFILRFPLKKDVGIKYWVYLVSLPASYMLASFSIMGWEGGATYHLMRDFFFICLLTLAYYLLVVSIYKFKTNRL